MRHILKSQIQGDRPRVISTGQQCDLRERYPYQQQASLIGVFPYLPEPPSFQGKYPDVPGMLERLTQRPCHRPPNDRYGVIRTLLEPGRLSVSFTLKSTPTCPGCGDVSVNIFEDVVG